MNVDSQTILARPIGVFRHLDISQRFALTRHISDRLEQ
jgi:hypothetical protein